MSNVEFQKVNDFDLDVVEFGVFVREAIFSHQAMKYADPSRHYVSSTGSDGRVYDIWVRSGDTEYKVTVERGATATS